jgi:hypothetical protein
LLTLGFGCVTNTSSEAWAAIARSPLFSVYVYELHWLASDVVRRSDGVFERTPPPAPGTGYIHIDSSLHAEIYALLGDAAKIRALISERRRMPWQSQEEHELLGHRARALSGLLSGLRVATICSADARNSVEHFDEKIDQTALSTYNGMIAKPVNVLVDLVVWSRDQFDVPLRGTLEPRPGVYPLRVYVASERRFLNTGAEIDLGALRDECAAVRDRLAASMPDADERGAFVVVITESSFDQAAGA